MSLKSAVIPVTTTRVLAIPADVGIEPGCALAIKVPTGGATVYLGGSDVDTTNGYPIAGGETMAVDLEPREAAYLVVAAGSQAVNVLAAGV